MMSRKATARAGKQVAQGRGVPAIKFSAGIRIPEGELGSGYLQKAANSIRANKRKRQSQIDKIMKELD
jgi:hypothetical protein